MSEFADLIKQEYGTPETPVVEPTNPEAGATGGQEAVTQPEVNPTNENQGQGAEVIEEGNGTPNNPETPETPTPVFDWGHLSERTEGAIKDEDSFNSIINKAKEYDALSTKVTELESNRVTFASPFVETLNKLQLDGASPSQIEAYYNLNKIGDLSTMTPKEQLIIRDVLINGSTRETAEYRVNSKYDLSGLDENDTEYKAIIEDQRIDANKAIKELEVYRAENSVVSNPEKEQAEQQRLAQVAAQAEWAKEVKSYAPELAKSVPSAIKVGNGNSELSLDYSDDFKGKIPKLIENFFEMTNLDPKAKDIQEKINHFVDARYKIENFDNLIQDYEKRLTSKITEQVVSKYENPSGTRREEVNPSANPSAQSHEEWLKSKFG